MGSCRDYVVLENILEAIGHTPLVRLNRIPKDHGLKCEMYAKCEFMNPGGSLKDRIALTMMVDGEKNGVVTPKTRLVEPTSGNTGIGVSLACAVRGYKATIVTPDKNSDEKMSAMRLLGSEIVQTPATARFDDPDGFVEVTKKILKEDPNARSLDQYDNQINPYTHYKETAEEIIQALKQVDMFVMGAGTGGTVTGVANRLKKFNPKVVIVAVDPKGSIIFGNDTKPVPFYVEGIGGDFVPDVLDKSVIDKYIKPDDKQSFNMSRELIRKEGLLCGGSSGAITYSAIQAAKELNLGPDKTVVVILPDGIRNYMTKFVTDQWMEAHLFMEPPQRDNKWWNKPVSELKVIRSVPSIKTTVSCKDALVAMGTAHNVAFVVDKDGYLKGVASKNHLRTEATNPKKKGGFDFNAQIIKHTVKNHYVIAENKPSGTVGLASRILDITPFVVVVEEKSNTNNNVTGFVPKGLITPEMVLDYIILHNN